MMNNSKFTNAMALATAIKVLSADEQYTEAVEKLQKMAEQLEKKKSYKGSGKPTPTQIANEAIKTEILAAMVEGERYTITEIMKLVETEISSNQKATALMYQLIETGKVTKEEIKRKKYFSLVTEE